MKTFKQKLVFRIVITVLGIVGGYLYYYYVGCASGTCPIKSKWYLTCLYGGVIGYLVSGLFIKDKPEKEENSDLNKN